MLNRYNADYIKGVMRKPRLLTIEHAIIMGDGNFGLSEGNTDKFDPAGFVDEEPEGWDSGTDFNGWNQPGEVYCAKCWSAIAGVPREILAENECPACGQEFYDPNDTDWLDRQGFRIYRRRVRRYTREIAVGAPAFLVIIPGSEHLRPRRKGDFVVSVGHEKGFETDHIYSKRGGFEEEVPSYVIGSPPNLRVVRSEENSSKGEHCTCSLTELQERYASFTKAHPEWERLVRESDERQYL